MKAGTIISCPSCGCFQIKSTKDLLPGQQMKEAEFISLGFEMDGHRPGCFKCGERFVREHPVTKKTQLHTEENGWVPLAREKPINAN